MIRTILIAAALVGFGLVIGRSSLQTVPVVKAQSPDACTLASIKGSYGYHNSGFFYDSKGNFGVYAAIGRFVADGNGFLTAVDTISVDGAVTAGRKLSGTYTINADCTGSAIFSNATSGAVLGNWDMVLVSAGKEILMNEKDSDIILSGSAKVQ